MKILQTIGGFGLKSGGTTTCTYDLLRYMRNATECRVDILTPNVNSANDTLAGNGEEWIKVVENDYKTPLSISKNIRQFLCNSDYDLYHTNGLWMYANHITAKIAREKAKPFVLTPHGMLIENAVKRHYWKKLPMLKLWFQKDIANAACIHATSKPEAENIRKFGYKGPIAIIPNPNPSLPWLNEIEEHHELKRIGFLGRLHPVKNVDRILQAWKLLGEKVADAELVLIGSGTAECEQYLKNLAAECRYGKITFCGFVNGKEKFQTLASLRALCLVSDFENFGMTVTEALSVGTPVIASYGTPWEELNTERCGWWIDAALENIAAAIDQALSLSGDEVASLGDNGKRLVAEKYSAGKVAQMMAQLYQWLLCEGERPEFVSL